jgi:hypothetical protein
MPPAAFRTVIAPAPAAHMARVVLTSAFPKLYNEKYQSRTHATQTGAPSHCRNYKRDKGHSAALTQ